jgi:hypothetical protein
VRAVNGIWVIQAGSRCPRHGKEGTTMPRKVTAIADLTAIGCRVETTATAAEKVRWLDRDPVIAGSRFTRPGGCGGAGEGQKAASGATLARRVRRKRKIAGAVNLV